MGDVEIFRQALDAPVGKPLTYDEMLAAVDRLGAVDVTGHIAGRWNDMLALPPEREN